MSFFFTKDQQNISTHFCYLWWCIFLFVLVTRLHGQEPIAFQYNDQDGLPSTTIYGLIQDHENYIWLATEHGVCKFDGKSFKTIQSSEMEGQEFLDVEIDQDSVIWLINFSGQLFKVDHNNIENVVLKGLPDQSQFFDIFIDSKNRIWLAANKGLYLFNRQTSEVKIQDYYYNKKDQRRISTSFGEGSNQTIWTSQPPSPAADTITLFSPTHPELPAIHLAGRYALRFSELTSGKLICFAYHNPLLGYIDSGQLIPIFPKDHPIFNHPIYQIKEDRAGNIWILTSGGAYCFDQNFNAKNNGEPYLSGYPVVRMIQDGENNYWFATFGDGIFVMPSLELQSYSSIQSNLPSNKIFSLSTNDKGELLIGMDEGWVSILHEGKFQNFRLPKKVRTMASFYHPKNKYFYVGSDQGMYYLKNNKVHYLNKLSSIKSFSYDEKNNYLWSGMSYSALRINLSTLKRFKLNNERTFSVFHDSKDRTWIATVKGLFYYSQDSLIQFNSPTEPIPKRITSIQESKDGTIWLATYGQGVWGINDQQIVKINEQDGLSSNICKALIYDSNQHLWVGTDKGLNKINLSTKKIELANNLDGLISNEINALAIVDEKIWVGTPKGLSSFDVNTPLQNTTPPPVKISSIRINDELIAPLPEHELAHFENRIEIRFIGFSYQSRNNIKYKYQMPELDSSWYITTDHVIRYSRLNPGTYTFNVKAINSDNLASEIMASTRFIIKKPYYKETWFTILLFSCLIGLGIALLYFRFDSIRRKEKEEQEITQRINQLRMEALQSQMNPHFVFNALNAILHLLSINDRKSAMNYLALFARLIRLIFEHSKQKMISLENELEFLRLYLKLEKLRFEDKIAVHLEVEPELPIHQIKVPPLLIQPVIENAFKHGLLHREEGGELFLQFRKKDQFLICTIEDNGVGRLKAEELNAWRPKGYKSSGLQTTKERLAILNGISNSGINNKVELLIEDLMDGNQPMGTRVQLRIRIV